MIGQLYYAYYLRSGDGHFLAQAHTFYSAIRIRSYLADADSSASNGAKRLRYYIRFILASLLLNKREVRLLQPRPPAPTASVPCSPGRTAAQTRAPRPPQEVHELLETFVSLVEQYDQQMVAEARPAAARPWPCLAPGPRSPLPQAAPHPPPAPAAVRRRRVARRGVRDHRLRAGRCRSAAAALQHAAAAPLPRAAQGGGEVLPAADAGRGRPGQLRLRPGLSLPHSTPPPPSLPPFLPGPACPSASTQRSI